MQGLYKTEISYNPCRVPDRAEISDINGAKLVLSSPINATGWLGLEMDHKTNIACKNPPRHQGLACKNLTEHQVLACKNSLRHQGLVGN